MNRINYLFLAKAPSSSPSVPQNQCKLSSFPQGADLFTDNGNLHLEMDNEFETTADDLIRYSEIDSFSIKDYLNIPRDFVDCFFKNKCELDCVNRIKEVGMRLDELYSQLERCSYRIKVLNDTIAYINASCVSGLCGPIPVIGKDPEKLKKLPSLQQSLDEHKTTQEMITKDLNSCVTKLADLSEECARYAEMNSGMGRELQSNPAVMNLCKEKFLLSKVQSILSARAKAIVAEEHNSEIPWLADDWNDIILNLKLEHGFETAKLATKSKRKISNTSPNDTPTANKRKRSNEALSQIDRSILIPETAINTTVNSSNNSNSVDHVSDSGELSQVEVNGNNKPMANNKVIRPQQIEESLVMLFRDSPQHDQSKRSEDSSDSRTTLSSDSSSMMVNVSDGSSLSQNSIPQVTKTANLGRLDKENETDSIKSQSGDKHIMDLLPTTSISLDLGEKKPKTLLFEEGNDDLDVLKEIVSFSEENISIRLESNSNDRENSQEGSGSRNGDNFEFDDATSPVRTVDREFRPKLIRGHSMSVGGRINPPATLGRHNSAPQSS
ncbi:hypothetical protein HK098_000003 [Nowakowskiella sp. JEL0407]|nr:hypothetical protein HK098_000003 [Nowakowskiella sp. JEL0407]